MLNSGTWLDEFAGPAALRVRRRLAHSRDDNRAQPCVMCGHWQALRPKGKGEPWLCRAHHRAVNVALRTVTNPQRYRIRGKPKPKLQTAPYRLPDRERLRILRANKGALASAVLAAAFPPVTAPGPPETA